MKTAIFIGIAMLATAWISAAQSAEPAFTNDLAGKQVRLLWEEAQKGDLEAQTYLATMYWGGIGVPQDHCKALSWFERAGRQGFGAAQAGAALLYLGRMCGQGDDKRFIWAYAWLTDDAVEALSKRGNERDIVASLGGDEIGITTFRQFRERLRGKLSPSEVRLALRLREKLMGER